MVFVLAVGVLVAYRMYGRRAVLEIAPDDVSALDSAASRAYFAMFYSAHAALMQRRVDVNRQRGIRSAFVETFVESGQLPEHAGEILEQAQRLQEMADYTHQFSVSARDAERLLQEAEAFVNTIETMVPRETHTKH